MDVQQYSIYQSYTPSSAILIFYFFFSGSITRNSLFENGKISKCDKLQPSICSVRTYIVKIIPYRSFLPTLSKLFLMCNLYWKTYFSRHVKQYLLCDLTIDNSDINTTKPFIVVWLLPS